MRILSILALAVSLLLTLSACNGSAAVGKANPLEQPPTKDAAAMPNQPMVVQLEKGKGSVVVIPGDDFVQFIVSLKELGSENYEIALVGQGGSGALFSEGNVHVHIGQRQGETSFVPANGQLLVWSLHPKRLVQAAREGRIVIRNAGGDHSEIARSQILPSLSQ